jgi:SAM-dependent methyltransferase
MRSNPYYDEPSLERFYTEYYRSIYSGWKGDKAPEYIFEHEYRVGERIATFLQANNLPVPQLIYDIGCGAGGTVAYFKEQGSRSVGCDFDGQYISYGCNIGLDLRLGSYEALPNEPADLIVLNHCIEHLPNPIDFLSCASKRLSHNGLIYVSVPGIFHIHATYGDVSLFLQNAHVWHFCLRTLDFTCGLAGYKRVWGNEEICALYRRWGHVGVEADSHLAEEIMHYLLWTERKGRLLRYRRKLLDYLRYYARNSLWGVPYRLYRYVRGRLR